MTTTRYYVDDECDAPEPVECNEVGYPRRDVKGRVQYDNTHFDTEAEAWERLASGADARVSLAGHRVQTARATLRQEEEHAARATEHFAIVRDGLSRFRRREVP